MTKNHIRIMTGSLLASLLLCTAVANAQSAAQFNATGVEHYSAGRWREAIAHFERAYERAPDNETVRRNLCNAHQGRANAFAREADFKAAAEHLEIAISVDPRNHSPLMQLGSYYLRLDMVPDAIFRLEEALELAMDDLRVHELLGEAYYRDNDLAAARTQWEWVLEQDPTREGLRERIEKASREENVEGVFRGTKSRHFKLKFPPGTPNASLQRVRYHLERAYLDIGQKFGREFPPNPVWVIIYNAKGFTDVTQLGEHVGALFDGKIRIPLVDSAGNVLEDDELKRRLYHEYTHVIVRYIAAQNVPWWLNEGLAETFSRDFGPNQKASLADAQQQGALFPLAELEGSQLRRLNPQTLKLAYQQSHATVHFLWARFGQRRLRDMMSSLAEGLAGEEALRANYRLTYDRLENEVTRKL